MKADFIVYEEREKTGIADLIKRHKGVIIAGTCFALVTIAGIVIYKRVKRHAISASLEQLQNLASTELLSAPSVLADAGIQKAGVSAFEVSKEAVSIINGGEAFDVSKHLRNLSGGRCPSEEKIRTALANGFNLGPHQTWVEQYTKNLVA